MNKRKWISRWILITGIIICIISIIHVSFAPAMYRHTLQEPTLKDKAAAIVYFFALGGFAFLFAGLLTIYASFGLKKSETWAWFITIGTSLFVVLAGISAITFAKFENPLIHVMDICAVSNVFLLFVFNREFKSHNAPAERVA